MSQTLAASKRLIVKIGSALLADDKTGEPQRAWLEALLADIAALRKTGTSVVIVTSGAVAIGRRHLKIGRASCRERVAIAGVAVSSRRRHTRWTGDWSSDVCSSDLSRRLEAADRQDRLGSAGR